MLASLLLVMSMWPGQAGTVAPSRQVARLVRQLDADQLADREAAEQALIELGPKILVHLPHGGARLSPEVKERLARVRSTLQVKFAEQSVAAGRVTLRGELPLADVLAELTKQTGNHLAARNVTDSQVRADFRDVPFWRATDQILDQAGMAVDLFSSQERTLRIVPRLPGAANRSGHACYQGLFRIEPTQITAVRDLRNPAISAVRVRLEICWEPRATPILLSLPLDRVTARDDLGRTVASSSTSGSLDASIPNDMPFVEVELPFELPDRSAKKIAVLQGTMLATLPGDLATFEFDTLAGVTNERKQRAGVTVTLERVRKNEDVDEVRLRIRFDEAANALESHRGWIFKNEAYIVDSQGKRIDNGGLRTTSQAPDEVGIAYLFALDEPLDQYKFYYKTPSLIVRQPVPYVLHDIALP